MRSNRNSSIGFSIGIQNNNNSRPVIGLPRYTNIYNSQDTHPPPVENLVVDDPIFPNDRAYLTKLLSANLKHKYDTINPVRYKHSFGPPPKKLKPLNDESFG